MSLFLLLLALAQPKTDAIAEIRDHGPLYQVALRVIPLRDGSRVIVHKRDDAVPSNIRGAIEAPNGELRLIDVADSLPPRSVLDGARGQVLGATLTHDNQWLAVSAGWADPTRRGHNGIIFYEWLKGGGYWRPRVAVDIGCANALAEGPNGTVVAAMFVPALASRPIVGLLAPSGALLAYTPAATLADNGEGCARMDHMLLRRVDDERVAVYDDAAATVTIYRLRVAAAGAAPAENAIVPLRVAGGGSIDVVRTISVAALPELAQQASGRLLKAFDFDGRTITIVRSFRTGAKATNIVSRYDLSGNVLSEWPSPKAWGAVFFENGAIHAVTLTKSGARFVPAVQRVAFGE